MVRKLLILVICVYVWGEIKAEQSGINIRKITPVGGLSFQVIHDITQDKNGNIWLGTYEGIYKYDAKNFTHFHYSRSDSNSLVNNEISGIVVDENNILWIGTHKGISCFNQQTQSFSSFKYSCSDGKQLDENILRLLEDRNNDIWLIDKNGVGKLDTAKHKLNYLSLPEGTIPTCLFFDNENQGFLGTREGLVYRLDTNSDRVQLFCEQPGKSISTIYAEKEHVWLGYEKYGVQIFNKAGHLLDNYIHNQQGYSTINNEQVRDILKDNNGNLWIATYNGLYLEKDNQLYHITQDQYTELTHNSTFKLYKDHDGGIWIGTWAGGLNYVHYSDNLFHNFRKTKSPNSLSNNIVSSFLELEDTNMLVGTEMGGLNVFNKESRRFNELRLDKNMVRSLNIKCLYRDVYGGVWVGTYSNGIYYRKKNNSSFVHFAVGQSGQKKLSSNSIYSIVGNADGVWIGTDGGSVDFYCFKRNKILNFETLFPEIELPCKHVRTLLLDANNNLWIGTYSGLFKIEKGKLTTYGTYTSPAISNFHILHLTQMRNGDIWIGTKSGGVTILKEGGKESVTFDAQGLLKEVDVYGIIEDSNNKVWISSRVGIIYYDPLSDYVRQFIQADGIQGNVFNPQAIYMDSHDQLYVGGTNGFTSFNPLKIKINRRAPKILFNKLIINNKKELFVNQFKQDSINRIQLKPSENAITIDFSADNYLLSEKNKFQYRLLNFNDEWIDIGHEGTAVFTNLPSGDYIFQAKACNNDGIWNDTPTALHITIATPWWRTGTANLIYFIISVCIISLIYRFLKERQNLRRAVFIEKVERENKEQIHEMKIKFFTNISHEFRTPLTLISGPIKRLLSAGNLDHDQRELLEVTLRNSDRLLNLTNKVLDLQKIEQGYDKLNLQRFMISAFINERVLNFTEEAKAKNIAISYVPLENDRFIEADSEMLDKIIFNLLSNSFKFTPKSGNISIIVSHNKPIENVMYSNQLKFGTLSNEDFFEIAIKDTGSGIESEDLLRIYNRFEKGNQTGQNSSGIGLDLCKEYVLLHDGEIITQSNPGSGTCVLIRLPEQQLTHTIISSTDDLSTRVSVGVDDEKSIENSNESSDGNKRKKTILIVEDNRDLRDYVARILQSKYVTLEATNGKQAIELLESSSCDLVVSDVMMPHMDGFQLCDAIKSNVAISHIPVVLLTALSSDNNKMMGLDKGADAYISKPFEDVYLLKQIENLLKQRANVRRSFKKMFATDGDNKPRLQEHSFIQKIDHIIEESYANEAFSVEILAQEIGLHRSQLHRKLKQLTSYTATEYIRLYRLKKGAALLKDGQYNVDEVTFLIGFGSRSYFSKCFKEYYKLSPKLFQQKSLEL
ncbi:hybrid sensor histidine kinase/response regulator [Puteibacter caeruleilacunae]|nr:hybrid sensor histidine kinase/response regulator [Puteibacter caeruleilacunae]